jgi:hypothetical protein
MSGARVFYCENGCGALNTRLNYEVFMVRSALLAIGFGAGLLLSSLAHAACPAGDVEARVRFISKTDQCSVAIQRAAECATAGSADIPVYGAAQDVCESKFLSKLTGLEKTGYESLLARCVSKFAFEDGSFYRSQAALCRLQLSADYSRFFFSLNRSGE